MKRITDLKSLDESNLGIVEKYIVNDYLQRILTDYNLESIKEFGEIIILEKDDGFPLSNILGQEWQITEGSLEFADKIFLAVNTQEKTYFLGCFIIDNDRGVYIFSDKNILSAEDINVFENAYFLNEKHIKIELEDSK